MNLNTARHNRGFTLIDFMIALTIAGILLSQAIPSFTSVFLDKKLVGEAESIATSLQVARNEAVTRNQPVSFSVLSTPSGATCHVVHTGAARDCSCADNGTATCVAPNALVTAGVHATTLRASMGPSIRFDPRTGFATPAGTVRVATAGGKTIENRVAITGRVRVCGGDDRPTGVQRCPR